MFTIKKETLIAICDKIREKLGTSKKYTSKDISLCIDDVYLSGKETERNNFWNVLQNRGSSRIYYYAFAYNRFTDASFNPQHSINCSTSSTGAQHIFSANTSITDTKVPIIVNGTNMTGMFNGATKMKTIRELRLIKENVIFTAAFADCNALTDITITGVICNNISFADSPLAASSLINIIGCLSETVSDKTATFKLSAVNAAFETSIGANNGSSSEEWLTLVASKPNWKIDLV